MYLLKITKNGQISIPKEIYLSLGITDGGFLFIYQEKDQLLIQSSHTDNNLNQCVFRNGKLTIPAELRKILNINDTTLLHLQPFPEESKLLIEVASKTPISNV